MKEKFKITGDYIELIKLLKASGICETGGMAKSVVEDGMVFVDGKIETRKRKKLNKGQVVKFQSFEILVE